MRLQQSGEKKIVFGVPGNEHEFKIRRRGANEVVGDFKVEDVEAARAALLDACPDDAAAIDRYAERLLRMVG